MEILQRYRSSVFLISVFLCTACIITSEGDSRLPVIYVTEGSPFELTCKLTFFEWPKWQRDGRDLPDDKSFGYVTEANKTESGLVTRLFVEHAQHQLHTAKYRCTSFRNESQVVVRVSGLREETKALEYYHKLVLECNLTGVPETEKIIWSKEGVPIESSNKYHIKDSGRNLTVVKAGEDDVGKYSCEAVNVKNTSDSRIDFNVLGKPYVKCPDSLAVVEGTTLRLECTVLGYPTPEVKWFAGNGTELDTKSGRVKFETFKNISNAAIVIKEATLEDRAYYNCTAINSADVTSFVSHVRIKDKLAALWPFLGICAEVVVLCTIILIYEKKRNKTELDESDTDQSPEQKNTPDHGKDVRQRK